MNVFNRVVVVVLLVLLVAVVAVAGVFPGASLGALRSLAEGLQPLIQARGIYIWWAVAASLIVLALLLLVLELHRPQRLTVQVRQASGGMVELTTESVSRSLEYHIGQVPGVTQVRPRVESSGKAVRVWLDLETDPLVDVPAKSEEVMQLARELVEGKLGLKMAPGSLRVSLRQAAFGQGGAVTPSVQRPPEPRDLADELSLEDPTS